MSALYEYDRPLIDRYGLVCGVDEAGRGPLAGPVCAAAVILDEGTVFEELNDSKKLTEKRREALYPRIIENALSYKIVLVGPVSAPALALIDGNRCPQGLGMPARAVVKGDATSACIAAASVLAKVTRDRYMVELGRRYPQYQFEKHKGYPTKLHYELIGQYGIQDFYRKSFLKKRGIV